MKIKFRLTKVLGGPAVFSSVLDYNILNILYKKIQNLKKLSLKYFQKSMYSIAPFNLSLMECFCQEMVCFQLALKIVG